MIFNSTTFLFLFLPILTIIYFISPKKSKNIILLLASIVFYSWGEPRYIWLICLCIISNYIFGILINKMELYKKYNTKKIILSVAIFSNVGILIYFKYFNSIIETVNLLFKSNLSINKIIMPLGVSFFTFQAMSYVIDVYRKQVDVQKNIIYLALYIMMFPQLISGPIVKYKEINEQIINRRQSLNDIYSGIQRFILGLAKKVIIANTLGQYVDIIFKQSINELNQGVAIVGMIAYSLQLYYDFSGYSDMAIGLARVFGFNLCENFNYPYISKSIGEFWRRWHISLSNWFKDYIYIPLGGGRNGIFQTCRNIAVVFLVTGIWHGSNWTFIIWGILHGIFVILERIFKDKVNKVPIWVKRIYTLSIVSIGWIIFRSETIQYAIGYLKVMLGFVKSNNAYYTIKYFINIKFILILVIAIIFASPIIKEFILKLKRNEFIAIFIDVLILIVFLITLTFIGSSTYNGFIYFKF